MHHKSKLQLIVLGIQAEFGYSRAQAYVRAHKILDAMAEMAEAEEKLWRHEMILEIKGVKIRGKLWRY